MKKFIVDPTFWDIFPDAQVNVLIIHGCLNEASEEQKTVYAHLLDTAAKAATQYLTEETFSSNPVIAQWREAFRCFKTKKGARSSIEALLKRANQGRHFQPINPLVDLYNVISLTYGVPCGGEDLKKVEGDIHLGTAQGGEAFLPLGEEKDAPALPGEIIYYDLDGAICRCFNWREGQRTILDETTSDAVFFTESINAEQALRADQAMIDLQQLMQEYLHVSGTLATITSKNSSLVI